MHIIHKTPYKFSPIRATDFKFNYAYASGWMTEESGFISQQGIEIFVFYKASSLAPGRKINN